MKSSNLYVSLFIVPALLLFACNPHREASDLLRQAQSLVDTQPEKALLLIDSIFYPERSLSRREYMSYLVTRVQARHRNFLPIDEDTFIFIARDYFTRHNNDPQQTALALFYSGWVYEEQGNFENAMLHFQQAAEYAAKTDDINLKGLIQFNIGYLFQDAGLFFEALEEYKKVARLFANSLLGNAIERKARSFAAIGRMYMLLGQTDNAFAAFYKSLELARDKEDNKLLSLLHQNIHLSYFQAGDYESAEQHLRQALALNDDIANLPRYYLNFAHLFMNTNQPDSLNIYIDKLKQIVSHSDDLRFKVAVYYFLANEARVRNDFASALSYQQKKNENIVEVYERRLRQSVYEARQRHNYQRHQEAHTQALLRLQRQIIFLLILCLLISFFAAFIYHRILQHKSSLLSQQVVISTLQQTNDDIFNKQIAIENRSQVLADRLKEALEWKFNTLHKFSFLKLYFGNTNNDDVKKAITKSKEAVFGENHSTKWITFVETIDQMYPNLSVFIKEEYPDFSDTQFHTALLCYVGLQTKDIAIILNISQHAIGKARTTIRKKMGLSDNVDFCAVLAQKYQEKVHNSNLFSS